MNFVNYNQEPTKHIKGKLGEIYSFLNDNDSNIDIKTVESFGEEWLKFNAFTDNDISIAGEQYFDIVPDSVLNKNTIVLDVGCGSGRWTKFIAKNVKIVEAIDPSMAVLSAQIINKENPNVRITNASISNIPFADESFDFVICLGVLHHIPNTQKALNDVIKKLKSGGHILLYLYYNLENRGLGYKLIFKLSSIIRYFISKLPTILKKIVCDIIAIFVYKPFAILSKLTSKCLGKQLSKKIPLAYYSDKSFQIMRNDALDRFGTPLEQRFSKSQISDMLKVAGVNSYVFSENEPFWHVLGKKD